MTKGRAMNKSTKGNQDYHCSEMNTESHLEENFDAGCLDNWHAHDAHYPSNNIPFISSPSSANTLLLPYASKMDVNFAKTPTT